METRTFDDYLNDAPNALKPLYAAVWNWHRYSAKGYVESNAQHTVEILDFIYNNHKLNAAKCLSKLSGLYNRELFLYWISFIVPPDSAFWLLAGTDIEQVKSNADVAEFERMNAQIQGVITIKTIGKKTQKQTDSNRRFTATLTQGQAHLICRGLVEHEYLAQGTDERAFGYLFGANDKPDNFTPLEWTKTSKRSRQINKKSFFNLLYLLSVPESEILDLGLINENFNFNGREMSRANKSEYTNHKGRLITPLISEYNKELQIIIQNSGYTH